MTSPAAAPAGRATFPRYDEQTILTALLDAVTPDWFWELEDADGKKEYGISRTGTSEIARIRGEFGRPIRIVDVVPKEVFRDRQKGVEVCVIVRDAVTGVDGAGLCFKSNFIHEPGKEPERDQYNDRTAVTIAKRNAILDLIPDAHESALLKARHRIAPANFRRLEEARKADQRRRLQEARTVPPSSPEAVRAESTRDAYDETPQPSTSTGASS